MPGGCVGEGGGVGFSGGGGVGCAGALQMSTLYACKLGLPQWLLSAGGDCGLHRAAPLHAITGINAAAAAAAVELAAAIHSAPASQRALAAMAAGGAAATGTAAAGDGVVRVKVPGVAGHVELVSEAAGAAAGDSGSEGTAAEGLGDEAGEGGAEGEEEGRLPDLGAGEDGQPLSRKLRRQEGLVSWATFGQPAGALL